MSFSTELKTEILENKPMRTRYKKAQAYGLFAFSKSFTASSVSLSSENAEVARLFTWFIQDFIGRDVPIISQESLQNKKILHGVKLGEHRDREKLLEFFGHHDGQINQEILNSQEQICAFLSGAYLACGNITDPQKSYHVEFVVREKHLCEQLKAMLDTVLFEAKMTARRSNFVVYYKEFAQIEDLLTLIGASKSCLAMIDIEMIKGVRNSANRATNCETANIDKLVAAASNQIEDIQLVLEAVGEESLPKNLLAAARLRLDNPESSLRELSEISSPTISRTGLHHRLNKISQIAAEIRLEEEKSR